ncbi:unnamed protein product [Rotaria magnacalcarata]|uniref:ABC transporter domain-containing protein n=1 Tax=Rotaria magnacalcarata TaxID=392030 RepID=A0A815WFU8_9BILA|nr:unnamed protein product [Rotaria magnacalcarata]
MNAIMGPTGCGKSSLLDILADRKDPHGLSGQVFIDGLPPPPSFKYIVGYVVQEDIISGTLTVRENLMFSAKVRIPDSISDDVRRERVSSVIQNLGLAGCADSKIGTEFSRGVSGGEKKRTCIGMELVLEPKILFLDEPTTGLDASTARDVMRCLKELSSRSDMKRKSVYHGSTENIIPYFKELGYECEEHDNPADFALDVLITASQKHDGINILHTAYVNSEMHTNINNLFTEATCDDRRERHRRREQGAPARTFMMEIFYVSQRTLKNAIRNPALFLSQIVVAIVLGLLVGLVFNNMENSVDPGVQNRLGAIFFIIVSQIFSTVTALEPFLKERALFIHENVSGYYRITTFFIAKLLCDVLPMRIIPSIIFSLIAYFMTGLQQSGGQFFVFLLTIFMASVFGSATCFFISAIIDMFGKFIYSMQLFNPNLSIQSASLCKIL